MHTVILAIMMIVTLAAALTFVENERRVNDHRRVAVVAQ